MLKRIAAVLAAMTLLAAGCGDDDGGGGADDQERTSVTVGLLPITPVAPVFIAQEKGFFREENLEVKTQMAEGGAAIIPAVLSGDFDIGFSNMASNLIARSRGLPIVALTGGEVTPAEGEEDSSAIMVRRDSPIRTPQDLEGKEIGVNTLKNIAGLTTRAAMEEEGARPEFREAEVPFPEMLPTVQRGDIDAGFFNEPFTTLAKQEGLRTIMKPYDLTGNDLPIAHYFALESFVQENRDVVDRFNRAIERATEVYRNEPEEVRRVVLKYTEIPKPAAQRMILSPVNSELDPSAFEEMAELAQRFDLTEHKVDVSELLPER
jgi:NitT/TauT family transport system substrate-binding protein